MKIRLVISIRTRPGLGQLQERAFARLAPIVRAEAGCLQYDLFRVDDDPDRFVLLELWESAEALDAHDASAHMLEADATNGEFRAGPAEVIRLGAAPIA